MFILHCSQVPKALLQQHSDAFSAMLTHEENAEAVVLQDSVQAFREFRTVIGVFTLDESSAKVNLKV